MPAGKVGRLKNSKRKDILSVICSITHKWPARLLISDAYLFADDTQIFSIIEDKTDQDILQNDIKQLEKEEELHIAPIITPRKIKKKTYINISRT